MVRIRPPPLQPRVQGSIHFQFIFSSMDKMNEKTNLWAIFSNWMSVGEKRIFPSKKQHGSPNHVPPKEELSRGED